MRPNPPHSLEIERTAWDFTLKWKPPTAIDGDGDGIISEITHYAIEISTCAPSGTYCTRNICSADVALIRHSFSLLVPRALKRALMPVALLYRRSLASALDWPRT